MKTKIFILIASIVCMFSCTDGLRNDIDDLKNKYDNLDSRVAKLEEHCKEMNTNISSLQTLVSVILNNDYIVSITPIMKENKEIGYVITFAIHEPITIYHGQNGADGKDGQNGKDGADGITPIIGVAQDETDHAYYWTLNGEWLLDANGNRIPLTSRDGINGQDGQDGQDGKDGQDGITPRLKIENGYWFISYDNGVTWVQLGKAVGENGQDGKDGTNGQDGEKGDKGDPGDTMFSEVTQDDEFVYFTLYNGTVLTVRKGNSTFDQTIIDNLVTSLTLDQTEVWMSAIGETVQVNATTTPFPNSKVNWFSSDSTIVSVVDGLLTAIRTGQVTITAKAGDKTINLEVYVAIGDGLLSGEFSISETQKVRFSKGRLQYNPMQGTHRCADGTIKPGTWRFAENQYDALQTRCASQSSDIWYDLFYYGTSGYGSYEPWGNNCVKANLTDDTDWGRFNAISNGDDIPTVWRCLTKSEWNYVLNTRANFAILKKTCNVNGVFGLALLPDNYVGSDLPSPCSLSEWHSYENNGAIFLPGAQHSKSSYASNSYIVVWSSTYGKGNSGDLTPYPQAVLSYNGIGIGSVVDEAAPVRLVQDVK